MVKLTYHDERIVYVFPERVVLVEQAKEGIEGSTVYFDEDTGIGFIAVKEKPTQVADRLNGCMKMGWVPKAREKRNQRLANAAATPA